MNEITTIRTENPRLGGSILFLGTNNFYSLQVVSMSYFHFQYITVTETAK
jgi:hypothetical protein